MNLINAQVTHNVLGPGCVKSIENGYITIQFAENTGEKTFQYPGAFEHYLKLLKPSLQKSAEQDLTKLQEKLAFEKAEQERIRQEEKERCEAEALALRKTTVKKASAKAPKKVKA